jgi:glycosyltransferase involved in cell wall biosynthesis
MATVGLAMIVKDEALTLPRLAASLGDQLDHWTIVDTGSSDGTQAVAREVFGAIPGLVIDDEWRGYGPSRDVALAAATAETDWVLTLDADDTFHGGIDRVALTEDLDGLEAEYRYAELRWWVPRLLRSSAGWKWRGRAHEYLFIPGRERRLARLGSFYVEHHADGGNRGDKAARELALLHEDWDEGVDPDRTSFYIARTLEDAGRASEAVPWYRRRIGIAGWAEETWYARWRLARCLLGTDDVDEACGLLWSAWSERPWRPEPLWTLAQHYRLEAKWEAAWQACSAAMRSCGIEPWRSEADPPIGNGDRLFVHVDVWEWRMAYEISIAAWYVDERPIGRRALQHVLAHADLSEELRANVEANGVYYAAEA